MAFTHKSVGTELTQAEYEAADSHNVLSGVVAIDPGNIPAGNYEDITAAVANLLTTHKVIVQCEAHLPNGLVIASAGCLANGTLTIRLSNWSAGAIDCASKNWFYIAF